MEIERLVTLVVPKVTEVLLSCSDEAGRPSLP